MASGRSGFDISRVVITGFKCIREPLSVDLERDLNILVGDNGVGKSTILEALHLALTGQYRGEPIRRALSQSLFNIDNVGKFIADVGNGNLATLPRISIEVFLESNNQSDESELSGGVNSLRQRRCGFTFSIEFDESFREELESLPLGSLKSLPIEYYDVRWMTFADAQITPRSIPVRSVMINPAGEWRGSVDERVSRTLLDGLDTKHQMALAQSARTMFDSWNAEESLLAASGSLPAIGIEDIGEVDLVANPGTMESWKRNLVIRLKRIPYGHIGAGSQSMMQAGMELDKKRPEKTTLLLFEEPENHLSHTNLNKLVRLIAGGADGRKIVLTTHSSYVANVLGLDNLQIVGSSDGLTVCAPLRELSSDTFDYFRKLPGYDTLRLVLAGSAILVEGPSDELVVQLAYRQTHDGKLPIEKGIDVISVGSGFLRFLELASCINRRVLVLTDNDKDPGALHKKYQAFSDCDHIKVNFVEEVYPPNDPNDVDPERKLNWNTLEAEVLRANGLDAINSILGKSYRDDASILKYMEGNKTEVALVLFETYEAVKVPKYITKGLEWLDGKC
ncbi:putative ATP-dependent endonuclease of the OLD family [Collinsella sp. CAG:398]|nr:putative ATP-dependent endonuclease of the OLD family [Collinsella sp. CAG:398]